MHCLESQALEEKDTQQDLQPQCLTSYYKCHCKHFIKKKKKKNNKIQTPSLLETPSEYNSINQVQAKM